MILMVNKLRGIVSSEPVSTKEPLVLAVSGKNKLGIPKTAYVKIKVSSKQLVAIKGTLGEMVDVTVKSGFENDTFQTVCVSISRVETDTKQVTTRRNSPRPAICEPVAA
jgi:DNA/RNA endonuclease G (NUC1)